MPSTHIFDIKFLNSAALNAELLKTEGAIKSILKEINNAKKASFSYDKLIQEQDAFRKSLADSQTEMQNLQLRVKEINKALAEAKAAGDKGTFNKLKAEQKDLQDRLLVTKEKIVDATVAIRNLDSEIAKAGNAKNKFQGLIVEQQNLKAKLTEVRGALREQDAAFKSAKYPIDSIRGMELQYSALIKKIREMSAEMRNAGTGKALVQQAAALKASINKESLRIGDFTKNIGNYAASFKQGLLAPLQTLSLAGLGAGISQLGVEAIKSSINIEKLFFQIKYLTQSSGKDVELYKDKIAGISQELGVGQEALLSGLLRITSGGLTGAKALDLLQLSAKASAIGLGDVNVIAGTLTGVINAYGQNNLSAAKAAEVLFQTVKLGSGEVSQLAGPFSNVTTLAAKLGISIDTVGGAIAAITNKGVQAAESITQLESIMVALQKPTAEGEAVLNELNISYEELRKMAANNLPRALKFLNDQLGGNEEKITAILGRKEALVGFFSLAGQNAESFADLVGKATRASGELQAAFKAFEETNAQKIQKAWTGVKNTFIEIGGAIIDATTKIGEFVLQSTRFGAAIKKQADQQKAITVAEALTTEQRGSFNAGYDLTQSQGVLAPGAKEEGTRDTLVEQKLANDAAKKLEEESLKSKNAAQLAAEAEKRKKVLEAFRKRREFEEQLADDELRAKIALIDDEFVALNEETKMQIDNLEKVKRDLLEKAQDVGVKADIERIDSYIENSKQEILKKYKDGILDLQQKLDLVPIPKQKSDFLTKAIGDTFDVPQDVITNIQKLGLKFEDFITSSGIILNKKAVDAMAEDAADAEGDLFKLMSKQAQTLVDNTEKIRKKTKDGVGKINVFKELFGGQEKPKTKEEQDQRIEDREKELKEKLKEAGETLRVEAVSALGEIALGNLDQKQKEIEAETEMRLASLQYEYDKKREFAVGNAELIAKLDKEQADKAAVIQREQAKKQAKLNIQRVIIEGALAIAKTFAYYGFTPAALVAAALQAAMTIKQVAVIKAQGLAEGGKPKFIRGKRGPGLVVGPGTETSDSIPAYLSKDEYVLNARMQRA